MAKIVHKTVTRLSSGIRSRRMLVFFLPLIVILAGGARTENDLRQGREILPGVNALTGYDLKPFQVIHPVPELADPYASTLPDSLIVSGTAQYHLKFKNVEDLRRGGPYRIVWEDFYYHDGTPMEGDRFFAHSWDMKPVAWVPPTETRGGKWRLWEPGSKTRNPVIVWYGGHMRPRSGQKVSRWPQDNYSRDVFAFIEKEPGKWFSSREPIFNDPKWPRPAGSFLGHRYGHQIVLSPKVTGGKIESVPTVYYEEVTEVRDDGRPLVTKIFKDEMVSPFKTKGQPVELISPINPKTRAPYPSAVREDQAKLVEGPIYFRFLFEGEEWEAIGFSAGSFYGHYPAAFASRKVSDGLEGKPYRVDMNDQGTDFHNAGERLGKVLNMAGGPARPAVVVHPNGRSHLGPNGHLQVLVHGYRKEILPDNDYAKPPVQYRLDQMFRVALHASLKIRRMPTGALRFEIDVPENMRPQWFPSPKRTQTSTMIK